MAIAARLKPTSATANDTSGTPPKCAIASRGLSSWEKPTTPQGNPPNGTVDLSHSASTQMQANHTGQPGSDARRRREGRTRRGTGPPSPTSASQGTGPTRPLIHGSSGT